MELSRNLINIKIPKCMYPHQVSHDNGIVGNLPRRDIVLQTLGRVVVSCRVVTVSLYHQILQTVLSVHSCNDETYILGHGLAVAVYTFLLKKHEFYFYSDFAE